VAIRTEVEPGTGVLRVTLTGPLPSLDEMVKERARLIVAGQLKDDTMELVDIRGVTGALPNLDQARAILVALGRPPARRAFLAGTDAQYEIGRLVEPLLPNSLRVFRDEASALAWLRGRQ
jgi:hypothetical protein